MKKLAIILIAFVSIILFSLLVYYGFKYTRGVPVPIEESKRIVLEVPFMDQEIDLAKGIETEFWDTLSAQEIKLVYQIMVLP